ncbi:protein of unknown function [Paraburkholderia kururiensis]
MRAVERLEKGVAVARQAGATLAAGQFFERDELPFEQRVQFGAAEIDLVRRLFNQHQSGKFMWTQHCVSSLKRAGLAGFAGLSGLSGLSIPRQELPESQWARKSRVIPVNRRISATGVP